MAINITGDLATVITSAATAIGILVNVILQLRQRTLSKENGRKLDENTQATKEGTTVVAAKVDEVHASITNGNGNGKPP